MEGITEANVIGMAAGLAMEGYIPFVNTIATFITRRCYEQVAVDLCLHESAGAADRQWRRPGLRAARPDASRDRGHRDHARAAQHDGDGGLRRRGNDAADELHARLAASDLYPPRQGRRSGRQPRRERLCDRQGHPDAAGALAAFHRADGDRRHDDQLPRRRRSACEGRHRCFRRAFPHDQAARRGGRCWNLPATPNSWSRWRRAS